MNSRDRLNGKLIIALGRTYRNAHRKSSELFREKGLTLAQFTVLELLYNRGEQTVQSIIDKVLSSSGNITVVVRNLEQMGLVGRRDNPEDGRSYLIGITPKGKALMDETFAASSEKAEITEKRNFVHFIFFEEISLISDIFTVVLLSRKTNWRVMRRR